MHKTLPLGQIGTSLCGPMDKSLAGNFAKRKRGDAAKQCKMRSSQVSYMILAKEFEELFAFPCSLVFMQPLSVR